MTSILPVGSPPRVARPLLPTLLAAVCLAVGTPLTAQDPDGCVRCHGELELLRQHVATLEEARAVLAPRSDVAASAHGEMTCLECHSGFGGYPHPEVGGTTESCASCHEEAEALWRDGSHALDDNASCADCHGLHDVATVEDLQEPEGVMAMREVCASCHFEPRIPPDDPHADSASCAGCHAPHETLPPDDPASRVYPANQAETCSACHEEVTEVWVGDRHGRAAVTLSGPGARTPEGATSDEPPACSACHGAHGMLAPSHEHFDRQMVDRCAACHEDYADTYFGTYHGKATALGSEVVATCDHCHGAHEILPASEPASMVSSERRVETCASCHEAARPAFVLYDSHPDPMDRSRNAPLHYSFVFMNTLLIGVLGLFALHTFLWWLRLVIDKQKGIVHGIGEDHG